LFNSDRFSGSLVPFPSIFATPLDQSLTVSRHVAAGGKRPKEKIRLRVGVWSTQK